MLLLKRTDGLYWSITTAASVVNSVWLPALIQPGCLTGANLKCRNVREQTIILKPIFLLKWVQWKNVISVPTGHVKDCFHPVWNRPQWRIYFRWWKWRYGYQWWRNRKLYPIDKRPCRLSFPWKNWAPSQGFITCRQKTGSSPVKGVMKTCPIIWKTGLKTYHGTRHKNHNSKYH